MSAEIGNSTYQCRSVRLDIWTVKIWFTHMRIRLNVAFSCRALRVADRDDVRMRVPTRPGLQTNRDDVVAHSWRGCKLLLRVCRSIDTQSRLQSPLSAAGPRSSALPIRQGRTRFLALSQASRLLQATCSTCAEYLAISSKRHVAESVSAGRLPATAASSSANLRPAVHAAYFAVRPGRGEWLLQR